MSEKDRLKAEIETLKVEVFAVRDANAKMGQRMREAEANLAAAEERGRRSGVEEAMDLLSEAREHLQAFWGMVGSKPSALAARLDRYLAPRASARCPEPPPGALEAAEASARRGGQVGCGNIATYQAPRDSGKVNGKGESQ